MASRDEEFERQEEDDARGGHIRENREREPILSSYQRRTRLKNAICRVKRRSKQACGIFVQFREKVGILTTSDILPSAEDADECIAIFDLNTGDRQQVHLLPQTFFLSSSKLGFTLIACSDPGPAVPPVELHRGRNAGVENGERAHVVMLEETGEKKLVETKILRLTSPTFTYHVDDADDASLPPGSVILNGLQVIGMHKKAYRMERRDTKGILSKFTCGPSEAEVSFMNQTRKQGLLLCSILDFMELNIVDVRKSAEDEGSSRVGVREAGGGEKKQEKAATSLLGNMFSNFNFSSAKKPEAQINDPGQAGRSNKGGEEQTGALKSLNSKEEGKGGEGEEGREGKGGEETEESREEGTEQEGARPSFGIGLVLESWKPSNLSRALNMLGNTREAVKVHSVSRFRLPLPSYKQPSPTR
eukprot:764207-Hanusia_phi.AAC.4